MKTKEGIKQIGKGLFNQHGVKNITLREIAKQLGKSYGNITYHFPNKEKLISDLFDDMNTELTQLQSMFQMGDNLLAYFLLLPDYSFEVTKKYLFFYKDYVELKRSYPAFFKQVDMANAIRKSTWLKLLLQLQKQGYLKPELLASDLEYIMELSVGIRLFYFQEKEWDELDQAAFRKKVNQLLYPYLTKLGQEIFMEMQ